MSYKRALYDLGVGTLTILSCDCGDCDCRRTFCTDARRVKDARAFAAPEGWVRKRGRDLCDECAGGRCEAA